MKADDDRSWASWYREYVRRTDAQPRAQPDGPVYGFILVSIGAAHRFFFGFHDGEDIGPEMHRELPNILASNQVICSILFCVTPNPAFEGAPANGFDLASVVAARPSIDTLGLRLSGPDNVHVIGFFGAVVCDECSSIRLVACPRSIICDGQNARRLRQDRLNNAACRR